MVYLLLFLGALFWPFHALGFFPGLAYEVSGKNRFLREVKTLFWAIVWMGICLAGALLGQRFLNSSGMSVVLFLTSVYLIPPVFHMLWFTFEMVVFGDRRQPVEILELYEVFEYFIPIFALGLFLSGLIVGTMNLFY